MAKKKGAVNKSQAIRDYAKAHKTATPKTIAEALAGQGVRGINPQYVSTVLSKDRSTRKGPKKKVAKKRSRSTATAVGLESVEAAADFIASVGSVDEAKAALSAAEKIAEKLQ